MIAIFGGSFDPVHLGHLRIAEDVREFFGLGKIIFVPAFISPLKSHTTAPPEDRINMLNLAIKNNPFFELSDYEIKKGGKSYTVDTAKYYQKILPYKPIFIVGSDSILTFHKWKNPDELLSIANFIVVGRGKDSYKVVSQYLKKMFNYLNTYYNEKDIKDGVYFYDSRRFDISSTEIRERVKLNKSIKYLTTKEVEEYIYIKNLYKSSP